MTPACILPLCSLVWGDGTRYAAIDFKTVSETATAIDLLNWDNKGNGVTTMREGKLRMARMIVSEEEAHASLKESRTRILALLARRTRYLQDTNGKSQLPASVTKGPLTDASRERVISLSNFLSGLATNLFATGVLGTLGAMIVAPSLTNDTLYLAPIFGIICFVGAFGLFLLAQVKLGDLDKR